MTLQNFFKILDKYDKQLGTTDTQQLELLRGLPFYDWQSKLKSFSFNHVYKFRQNLNLTTSNTFNHAIGLPRKNGVEFPLFDYEQLLYNELQSHKHLWIKKATGLGITEFILRYMAWLCLNGDQLIIS